MVDQLITVDSDGGPREPAPVSIFANGQIIDFAGLNTASAISNARITSSAASTNATVVKSSAGKAVGFFGYNNNPAARYLKIYNLATAPNVGTNTPIVTIYLEPSDTFAFNLFRLSFSAGIAIAFTVGAADGDNTAVGAGDIMGFNFQYE